MGEKFEIGDTLAKLWRNKDKQNSIKQGYDIASVTAKCVDKEDLIADDHLLAINLSYFDPINSQTSLYDKSPKGIVGIYADSAFKPHLINEGKFGAGSEKALLELSNTLAKRGYQVYIFSRMNVHENWKLTVPCNNPRWLPIDRNDETDILGPCHYGFYRSFDSIVVSRRKLFDALILWREHGSDNYRFQNYAKKTILWSHDFHGGNKNYNPDFVYGLSKCHCDFLRQKLGDRPKYIVGCNGTCVDVSEKPDFTKKKAFQCVFASSWARGLKILLEIWPSIVAEFPESRLKVCYGRETWGVLNEEQTCALERTMESNSDTIESVGMLPYDKLVDLMKESTYLLFPCDVKAETFSIIAALSQQCGAVTIVRRVDALKEVVLQEPELLDKEEFRDYVLHMMGMTDEDRNKYALEQFEHASKYTWETCADQFEDIFKQ